jgi:uncharacterized protein YtpQ (UPF0354 family)
MTAIDTVLRQLLPFCIAGGSLAACAKQAPPVASPDSTRAAAPNRPAQPEPPPPEASVDPTTDATFTQGVLDILRHKDPRGAWKTPETLVLTNETAFVVNLERIRHVCSVRPETCRSALEHFTTEVLRIAASPNDSTATRSQLVPIIRPASYLEQIPQNIRTATLSEPVAADLVTIYVVDQGGAVRGASLDDLSRTGVVQAELAVEARKNLAAALPAPIPGTVCQNHSITVWATGNYFESSRLLLPELWNDIAAQSHGSLIAAVPAADALIIACNPSRVELDQLAAVVDRMWQNAERPLSHSLLEWTTAGWRQLRP